MGRTKRSDRRIRWAVGLVLAGCTPAQTPAAPEPDTDAAPLPQATASAPEASVTAVAASTDASATLEGAAATPVATVMARVDAGPPIDARALCEAYVKKASADPKGPKTRVPPPGERPVPHDRLGNAGDVDAHAQGSATGDVAVCRIVWERTPVTRSVMVAPRCCPPIVTPCPPASPYPVHGERTKVETALVQPDGKVTSSTLAYEAWVAEPPAQPYCGRRPEGFSAGGSDRASIGGALAEMAVLEAASVHAFARLAEELEHLGAPRPLVARVRAAQRDEVRHARAASSLARRHGATPRLPPRRRWARRSRVAIAIENTVEGQVYETYGAAAATLQAARAVEATTRELFGGIARDERAHAALAADVGEWLGRGLTPDERAQVRRAKRAAIARLERGLATACDDRDPLGMPRGDDARLLAALVFA